jgi:ATP/maltotriose-dependent transcriptional regulator MalT
MALAGGLQPAFNTVLRPLLAEAAGAHLGRLADLLLGPQAPKTSAPGVQAPKLSRRERQVAALLAEGLSNRDIGDRLHLTEQTVKWHVWKLFQKLGVRNRVGAVRRLGRLGLD